MRSIQPTGTQNYLAEAIIAGKKNYIRQNVGTKLIGTEDKMAQGLCKADNITSMDDIKTKYTCDEFETAVVSCASYAIYHVLNEAHIAVRKAIKDVWNHPLNNASRGFKKELLRLQQYNDNLERQEMYANGKEMTRIKVMNQYVHEDMEPNLMRLSYTVKNWLLSARYPDPDLMTPIIMAQTIADFACVFIDQRIEEVSHYRPSYVKLDFIVPKKLLTLITDVEHKILSLIPDTSDKDINDSKEIVLGIRVMEKIVLDLEQMQYYCGAGLEAEMGKEELLRMSPKIYYLIHPMEDPEWKAQKAQHELEELQKEEEQGKQSLAYTTKDVDEYETIAGQDVNMPLDISKVAELKGWKVKQ